MPGSLSTVTSPPMACTSREEIVRPRPVPPNLREIELSSWEKASKIDPSLSLGMPMPVSSTVNCTALGPLGSAARLSRSTTSPCSVNLIALPIRFTRIWRSRPGSPRTDSGTSASMSHTNSSPFSWARTASVLSVSPTVRPRLKGMVSISSLPASILEKSRMSLITLSSDSEDDLTMFRYSRCS